MKRGSFTTENKIYKVQNGDFFERVFNNPADSVAKTICGV